MGAHRASVGEQLERATAVVERVAELERLGWVR